MATLIEHNQTIDFTRDSSFIIVYEVILGKVACSKNLRLPGWILVEIIYYYIAYYN